MVFEVFQKLHPQTLCSSTLLFFLLRSHQTPNSIFPSYLLQVQEWSWNRRSQRRTCWWRTQSSYLRGVCICPPVASASRCSSWWSWRSKLFVKLLEVPHKGSVWHQCVWIFMCSHLNDWFCFSSVPYNSSSQWGTSSSCSMMLYQHITSKNLSSN